MSQRQDTPEGPLLDEPNPVEIDDGTEAVPPERPFQRLVAAPMVRRLSPRKLLIGLGIGLGIVMLAGFLGMRAVGLAVAWLHDQPTYRLPFDQITLDPPPPPWVRSGAQGLLDRVHERSRWRDQDTLRILDVDLAELADAFRLGSPWVRDVRAIKRGYPNRLTVQLDYREPVAWLRLGDSATGRTVILDGRGVVLPVDDLDAAEAMPIVRLFLPLNGEGPLSETPGLALALEPGDEKGSRIEPARAACRLAAYLKTRGALAGTGTNRSPLLVEAIHEDQFGLWIQAVEKAIILWRAAPGSEPPDRMTDDQKWDVLHDWLADHRLDAIQLPVYLRLDDGRVQVRRADG